MASESPRRHVLICGGTAESLVNFRGPLIRALVARGHRVTAAADDSDAGAAGINGATVTAALASWGVPYARVSLGRAGMNPLADLATLAALTKLMRHARPDVFLGYTIKPVVYGLIAARLARVPRRIAMITGLGYAFTDGSEWKRRLARLVAEAGYRAALRFADRVIFQNPDDRAFFLDRGLVRPKQAALVAGSGVDLAHYAPAPLPAGPPVFLMIARLLADKGVREFAAAARTVKRTCPEARFVLAGPLDSNPAAVQLPEVAAWQSEGILEYRGPVHDVRPEIAACHVYVLPSYREGMPRTVLEAMAMGRAVITADAPGCRETVVEGKSGLLVRPRDSDALAVAMLRLATDRPFMASAGAESLALARDRFDVNKVNAAILDVIEGH